MVISPIRKKTKHILQIFPFLVILIIILFAGPRLLGIGYANLGALGLLKLTCFPIRNECDPNLMAYSIDDNVVYQFTPNRRYFQRALDLLPGYDIAKIHLAEIAFITGERRNAVFWLSDSEKTNLNRSWLSDNDRYPSFLMAAWQFYLSNEWVEAIDNFRLGLFWAGEHTLKKDEEAYFNALGNKFLAQGTVSNPDLLLGGIYTLLSGHPDRARDILKIRIDQHGSAENRDEDIATAYRYLGKIAEASDHKLEAENSYRKAIELNPDDRIASYLLLKLLRSQGKSDDVKSLKQRINALRPTYLMGVIGDQFEEQRPVLVNEGWKLIGYEIEELLIADTHQMDILLWWENTGDLPLDESMVDTGNYVLQEQNVINLLPNPGMEWGVDDRDIPVGYDREFYTGNSKNLEITEIERNGTQTLALVAQNTPDIRSLALASRPMPVNPDDYTLMAGWIYHIHGAPNIGRNCWGDKFKPGGPFYIAYTRTPVSTASWIHAADLSQPVPGENPDYCEVLLINYESEKPAAWDQLLWVKIQLP
jgi:tetratricopeptide (TPR) repeat protein